MSDIEEVYTLSTEIENDMDHIYNGLETVTILKSNTDFNNINKTKSTLAYSLGKLNISKEETMKYINTEISTETVGDLVSTIISGIAKLIKIIWATLKKLAVKILNLFNVRLNRLKKVEDAVAFIKYMKSNKLVFIREKYINSATESDHTILSIVIGALTKYGSMKSITKKLSNKEEVKVVSRGYIFTLIKVNAIKNLTTDEMINQILNTEPAKYYSLFKLSVSDTEHTVSTTVLQSIHQNVRTIAEVTNSYLSQKIAYGDYLNVIAKLNYSNELYNKVNYLINKGTDLLCISSVDLSRNEIGLITMDENNNIRETFTKLSYDSDPNYNNLIKRFISNDISLYIKELKDYIFNKDNHNYVSNLLIKLENTLSDKLDKMSKEDVPNNQDLIMFNIILRVTKAFNRDRSVNSRILLNYIEYYINISNSILIKDL